MRLLHLHSAMKTQPFSPVFPLAESAVKVFCRLFLWNFKVDRASQKGKRHQPFSRTQPWKNRPRHGGHRLDSKAPCRAPNFIAKVVRKRIILIRITWQGKSFPPVKPNLSGNTLIMKGSLQAEPFAQDIDFILAQLTQVKLGRTAHAGHCLLACILPLGIVLTNRSPSIAPPKSPYNERLLASAAPRAQQPERGRALKRAALGASPPPAVWNP